MPQDERDRPPVSRRAARLHPFRKRLSLYGKMPRQAIHLQRIPHS